MLDDNTLEEKQNNYLVAVFPHQKGFGLAVADVSTGLFQITQFVGEQHQQTMLLDELVRLQPAEVLLPCLLYTSNICTCHLGKVILP